MKKSVSFFLIAIFLGVASFADILVTARPPAAALAGSTQSVTVPTLIDEFTGTSLNLNKWVVVQGNSKVGNGKLTLTGGSRQRTEIQSLQRFRYGVLQMVVTSANWTAQNEKTDSSFGFEIWQGTNGQCHYGVILVANGHLGSMRPQPDASGNCSGDPKFQAFKPISNWDKIRAGKKLLLTLTWAPKSVTLHIRSGNIEEGIAFYHGQAEPVNQLKIRLNADNGERYVIDYVRVVGIPWR